MSPQEQVAAQTKKLEELDHERHVSGYVLATTYDFEHPHYPRSAWRTAVEEQSTITGYWDWVANEIEHFFNDAESSIGESE
ncbi:hypothetical protein [Paraburkholderia sp. BCC1886]|uniref:hypothetical protein n=1 Tax=Paraburkholderia sp. BCC1886 TaxID=2562670 RepID=UPI0011839BFD|nr:hypothetical protein [Paraburkholderia sp. BCC1886]